MPRIVAHHDQSLPNWLPLPVADEAKALYDRFLRQTRSSSDNPLKQALCQTMRVWSDWRTCLVVRPTNGCRYRKLSRMDKTPCTIAT